MTTINCQGSIHEGHRGNSMELVGGFMPRVQAVFLDVPYGVGNEGNGVKGGNRDLAPFPLLHSSEFAKMAKAIADGLTGDDMPVVLIMSLGNQSRKARAGYIQTLLASGLKATTPNGPDALPMPNGTYRKIHATGTLCHIGGRVLPLEGIWVFSKSGKAIQANLDIEAVRPSLSDYKTAKPLGLLIPIVRQLSRAGDTWLDPFAGSAKLAQACMSSGRGSISIDLCHDPLEYAGFTYPAPTLF